MSLQPREDEGYPFSIRNLWATSRLEYQDDWHKSSSKGSLFDAKQLEIPPLALEEPTSLPTGLPFHVRPPDFEAPALTSLPLLDASSILSSLDHEYPLLDPPPLPSLSHSIEPISDLGEDIWRTANKLGPRKNEAKLLSWESFFNPSKHAQRPQPSILSEAGAETFDATVEVRAYESRGEFEAGNVIRSDVLLRSLWQLAIGRNSMLFTFDRRSGSFKQRVDHTRASGCTVDCSRSLIEDFIYHGTAIRRLRAFEETMYEEEETVPTKVALANAVSSVLNAIEQFFVEEEKGVRSLLQLQDLLERATQPIDILERAVEATTGASTDVEVVEKAFAFVEATQEEYAEAQGILLAMLQRVSQPWFQQIGESIGLSSGHFTRPSSANPANEDNENEDEIDDTHPLPSFLTANDEDLLSGTRQCFRYMQQHYPAHPLAQARPRGVETPHPRWEFTWEELEGLEKKAKDYEASLLDAVRAYESASSSELEHDGNQQLEILQGDSNIHSAMMPFSNDIYPTQDQSSMEQHLETSIAALNAPLMNYQRNQPPSDTLHTTTLTHLTNRPHPSTCKPHIHPPLLLTPSLSLTPLLRTRHNALTKPILNSLLRHHSLREHLHALSSFSLFTSGLFTSSLRTVLFSTDEAVEGSERKRGEIRRGGTMGLKLGSGEREAWPPTSGEVGLVLRGVIEDAWRGEATNLNHAKREHDDDDDDTQPAPAPIKDAPSQKLPGNISLTIRNHLPSPSIPSILNPQSLHALDFLRISYTPPPALAPLFPAKVLDLYDRVFALWLRLLRVDDAVTKLHTAAVLQRSGARGVHGVRRTEKETTTLRITHKSTTFTHTLLTHFRIAGVSAPWTSFIAKVQRLFDEVCSPKHERHGEGEKPHREGETTKETTSANATMSSLRDLHMQTLETISANLLLRKHGRGQKRAREALEGACSSILKFASLLCAGSGESFGREDGGGGGGEGGGCGGEGSGGVSDDDIFLLRMKETEGRFDEHVRVFVAELKDLAEGVHVQDHKGKLSKKKREGKDHEESMVDERKLRGNMGDLVQGLGWWAGGGGGGGDGHDV
ncbi:MAG: hypothetical protein M1831_003188 [Alyxoria varia]|nr:MAG: hypothetical protein M1831_003188 [Alyxoria varia]